jgi:Flp pilus assembly protein TadB
MTLRLAKREQLAAETEGDVLASRRLALIATIAVALGAGLLITVLPATAAFGLAVAVAAAWCLLLERRENSRRLPERRSIRHE